MLTAKRIADLAHAAEHAVLLQSWTSPVADPFTGENVHYISRMDVINGYGQVYPPALDTIYNNHAPLI